jgi:FkbM family methyltransferase
MNDLRLNQIKRFFQFFGIRISHAQSYKFPYDKENYPALADVSNPIIFDVGANIGQSTEWYRKSFPTATVYAFEPIHSVYTALVRNVGNVDSVHCIQKALGQNEAMLEISKIESDNIQTVQVLRQRVSTGLPTELITVTTLDDYTQREAIGEIHILKTDTEGFDLDVMKGAVGLLALKKIMYVLSEVTIMDDDQQHTNLFLLKTFLETYGYRLHSFYEIVHNNRGQTCYFNALFSCV